MLVDHHAPVDRRVPESQARPSALGYEARLAGRAIRDRRIAARLAYIERAAVEGQHPLTVELQPFLRQLGCTHTERESRGRTAAARGVERVEEPVADMYPAERQSESTESRPWF